jgi:hypothetical protein
MEPGRDRSPRVALDKPWTKEPVMPSKRPDVINATVGFGPAPADNLRTVYAVGERNGRTVYTRIGVAHVNRDDSITVKLDALPVGGVLQIRRGSPGPG